MVTAGLAFALAGGCPGRQLFMAGEGDSDAAIFALGMLAGAAISFLWAATGFLLADRFRKMAGVQGKK